MIGKGREEKLCCTPQEASVPGRSCTLAPVWHTCALLAWLTVFAAVLAYLRVGTDHPRVGHILFCSTAILFEWGVFAFTIWRATPAFIDYVAQAFRNGRGLLWDVAAALTLCLVSSLIAPLMVRILGTSGWASLEGMRPNNLIERAFWIATSISAGISEEIVFRGYLQKQLSGWTSYESVGILGQAAIFGLVHGYQGWKNMALVFILGAIFGTAVFLRRGLRANMIAHAIMDALAAF